MSIHSSDNCSNAKLMSHSADLVQSDRPMEYLTSPDPEAILQQQIQRQRLMMEIAQRIRQSLTITDILQATVDEVRQFLQTDRVLLFQFAADFSVTIADTGVGIPARS
jgi:hypothetical protein